MHINIFSLSKCQRFWNFYSKRLISNSSAMTKTAGIVIIGDEILKGQTQDTNSHHMCKALRKCGVLVKKISIIGDNLNIISSEVKKFSSKYDFVLTSGGIGPTHDDLTLEGVAEAFEDHLEPHPTLVALCERYFGTKDIDSPEMKLAKIPASSVLHFGVDKIQNETFKFPLISVQNVYIFPGVPVLLRRLIDNLTHLFQSDNVFHSDKLLVNALETEIASVLTECSERFKDAGITIGSYPDWTNNYYKVKVIIESVSKDATCVASNFLKQNIPEDKQVENYVVDPISFKGQDVFEDKFQKNLPLLHQKIMHSKSLLEEAFEKYSPDSICIGFNGGKDCTALLHLYYAVMCRKNPAMKKRIIALYIRDKHPFEELENFMSESVIRYNLELITLNGGMKQALMELSSQRPDIKAVVMGTRDTDPYSKNLTAFSPTDKDWPEFMRVNPILNWSYHDVWDFLRSLSLPYCVLYDRGYTSLGSRESTRRNEKLVTTNKNGKVFYSPAYTLQDGEAERKGRL